jgi:hypothetical protein
MAGVNFEQAESGVAKTAAYGGQTGVIHYGMRRCFGSALVRAPLLVARNSRTHSNSIDQIVPDQSSESKITPPKASRTKSSRAKTMIGNR